jgi:hypothetical protein
MTRRAHRLLSVLMVIGVCGLGVIARDAHASYSANVLKAFAGQIIVSDGAVEPGASDKETIAAFKKAKKEKVKGHVDGEEIVGWQFHYTAFLKKKGFTALTLEFYNKDGRLAADKRLDGIDPKTPILEGVITINENDGPAKGQKYTLKLVAETKGKDVVVATAVLTLD